ncbi:MAG TPA: hypothetical protein VJ762_08200 [Sphingobium sp.]|nr:hypothetical protein [Sphingobium sp.]
MAALFRSAGALASCLALSACLVTPGKFESTLDIRADRQFSFTYKGEILASDMKGMGPSPATPSGGPLDGGPDKKDSALHQTALQKPAPAEERFDGSNDDRSDETQMQAIAASLTKEKGFRSARYMGKHRFEIDYAISGRLTHAFLFPFNSDAEIVLPFVAVELRGDDRVRVKAPGYSNGFDKSGEGMGASGSGSEAAKALDGVFTLTTDAEIVSQNQEEGAQTAPQGKRLSWRITPLTSEAPTATLRVSR